jgi:hypothetical protein
MDMVVESASMISMLKKKEEINQCRGGGRGKAGVTRVRVEPGLG